MIAVREVQDRAVLRNHAVDKVHVSGDAAQLIEDAAGHEQHQDAPCARRGNRVADRRIERIVLRDGPVVIEREN